MNALECCRDLHRRSTALPFALSADQSVPSGNQQDQSNFGISSNACMPRAPAGRRVSSEDSD